MSAHDLFTVDVPSDKTYQLDVLLRTKLHSCLSETKFGILKAAVCTEVVEIPASSMLSRILILLFLIDCSLGNSTVS